MEQTEREAKHRLIDIRCTTCGAPANYDIKTRMYHCRYCGSSVGIKETLEAHRSFRAIQREKMNAAIDRYQLQKACCTGCGAEVIFDKGDALASCAFCGRALVRDEYLSVDTIPEFIIPFTVTNEEARDLLLGWCSRNAGKPEAKALMNKAQELKGCYLPYELVRGPVDCKVWRIEGGSVYECGGFVDGVFVNCSKKLDNLLLDAMEPYNYDELAEFDFAYVAGHQVKVADITADELTKRINQEVGESYTPVIQKTLEAKAVSVSADSSGILRLPVLLPVYYLAFDGYMAAVNGQTGKVSVRAIKESHYYILPWWLKAILAAVGGTGIVALGMHLLGAERGMILVTAACLGVVLLIVMLAAYSDNLQNHFRVERSRKIFTSKGGPYVRANGVLTQSAQELVRPATEPMFFMNIDGARTPVELRFTSFARMSRMLIRAVVVLFLPVIIALFLNGFNFQQLALGGSAVWFCIFVPVIPVYLIKFGRIDLYDNPWVYFFDEKGRKKRYKPQRENAIPKGKIVKTVLISLIKPPICFAVWFGIASFFVMCYLTAFGFD
ncbi:MAG: hypothetical protein E7474_14485 [Ruminococcaceae bacterium]|nr:hypothetical protein [Oscillospiraceae bacterium]